MSLVVDASVTLAWIFDSERTVHSDAERTGLTVYNAAYLALALRLHLPLATADRALRQAASSQGMVLLGA